MTKLSTTQQTMLNAVNATGRVSSPHSSGGRNAGRQASAWHRTANSLVRLGLVDMFHNGSMHVLRPVGTPDEVRHPGSQGRACDPDWKGWDRVTR